MKKLIPLIVATLSFLSIPAVAEDRVISIGGSVTETIYALEKGELLVGSDTTSYFPAAAAQLPKVGYMRALSSEGILSLKPSMILASEDSGPPTVLKQLKATGVSLHEIKAAKTIADVKDNILQIGTLLKVPDAANKLVKQLDYKLEKLASTKSNQTKTPRVLFLMNHGASSPMVAGRETSADAIIALAGGENVAQNFIRYKPLTPESAANLAPDVLLVSEQTLQQIGGTDKLLELPGMALTPAGKARNIVTMDALLLLGFGPRTADAAIELNGKLFQK
ncbi:heme/hemin ABC transporter substrate-binding protein [Sneathiella glossodoripedis]|uniref:heme/hemin ABC transporter substrate-binding protein n=1 Tax=Sneathiella glossodoripedis TaxID=418853 RepID=UPI000471BD48|nr:ABC transporter substrate-binding protein [Sneathiella glossodoripedis]